MITAEAFLKITDTVINSVTKKDDQWAVAGTRWLSQPPACKLYRSAKAKASISEHISNIFTEGELAEDAVDGKQCKVKYFSLSMILTIGYRLRSVRGTQFRRWAPQTPEQYLVKGVVIDDKR